MNAPIEDQLRDYFTMVDRMQGPVDTTTLTPDPPTLSLVDDTHHDTKNSATEVTMLSPNRNQPGNRSRIWMAVAASVAALALVGGLIVAANRDNDDNVPADQPTITVPDTAGVDGDALPPADLPTAGVIDSTCLFDTDVAIDDGSFTTPQNCTYSSVGLLPVTDSEDQSVTHFISEDPSTPGPEVTVGELGTVSAGYTTDATGEKRFVSIAPGVGDFEGETITMLGRSTGRGTSVADWTTEAGDAPLPTTEEGGTSADVSVTCSTEFVSGDDTVQVFDQTCTYASDDPRFVTAPELVRVRVFPVDPDAVTVQRAMFFTAQGESGSVAAGISEDGTTIRSVGLRSGTGEFEGQLIHDVMYLTSDTAANITGVIRSTVYPAG